MNIPTKDPLKPKPRLGAPQRGTPDTKLVEGTTDAAKFRGVTLAATAPTHGQVPMYSSITGTYLPSTIAVASVASPDPVAVGSATELRAGNTTIVVGTGPPTGPSASGDIVCSPGAIQRVEMLVNPRAGDVAFFSPTVAVAAPGITTTTQTTFNYTSTGTPISAGMYIQVLGPPENMFVTNVAGSTLTVQRGRLQSGATLHATGASVLHVRTQVVVDVNGGLRASGGLATSDLSLLGSSTQEIKVKAIYTPTPPTATYVGVPDGTMHLHLTEHDHAADTAYAVEIDGGGATGGATFRWSDTGGAAWNASGVQTAQFQTFLQNGVNVSFDYGTYQVGTRWDFTAIGTANQVELMRADTDADTLYLRNVVIDSTTDAYTRNFSASLIYTGALAPLGGLIQVTDRGTDVGSHVVQGLSVYVTADRSVGTTSILGQEIIVISGANQSGTLFEAIALNISRTYLGNAPTTNAYGIAIGNMGHASTANVAALYIQPQTAGTNTYNIWQEGTTGVNRLAAPTLIGANASPAAGLSLDVTGDAAVSSQLHVGAVTVPAAGVALQLTGGVLKMAATANNYIQDSAGNRHLTFASSTTAVAVTSSFAGDLRVNDQLGVGGAVISTSRVAVRTWVSDTAASGTLMNVIFDGALGANVTTRAGFAFSSVFQPSFDIAGFNATNVYGMMSNPVIGDGVSGGVVANHAAFYGLSSYGDGGAGGCDITVTDTGVFYAGAPVFSDSGLSVITAQRAFWAKNQGATQVVLAIGVDIETQSGATDNIGLRLNANFIEGAEMTAPAAPAANNARVWFQDTGAGKTELMVEFSSGGPIQLAVQP